jgi:anti-sigma regulatory factor (Ser/Thr protein kinase)
MGTVLARLELPNDAALLGIARAYTREVAAAANLPLADGAALVWAVEAACSDVIEHAYDPGETSTFTIAAELSATALTIALHERGLPFDPRQVSADGAPPAEDAAVPAARGALWQHISLAVDEAHWINHGPAGMELRLTKARPIAAARAAPPADGQAPRRAEVPLTPEQTYSIRRLQPSKAIEVCQLIYRTYGYTYPNEDLYYPDRLVQLNEAGELISVVALDAGGAVVGHYALERPGLGPVAESAQAAVSPAHRGRKLMERMRVYLEEEGRRVGLRGIFGQPVTTHTYSQRVQADFGGRVCGVSLGIAPAVEMKQIADLRGVQRLSLMLYFKYLDPPTPAPIHVPAHHRAIVQRIYDHHGAPVELARAHAPSGRGKVTVGYARSYGLGTIRVTQIGADTAAEVRRARADLVVTAGVEAVFLELPLAQPAAAHLWEAAEADGFFFSGIGPRFAADGDALRLQYLAEPLDTARLQVLDPFGQELLAYVDAERERVADGAARRGAPA